MNFTVYNEMTTKENLTQKISGYFRTPYTIENTTIIPTTDYSRLTFGNKALTSELAFLFADIRSSSNLHETYGFQKAAMVYQSFHDISVKIITEMNGKVRAFDGDRVMGVFSGETKCTNAVKAAMKINWCVINILNIHLNPKLEVGFGIDFGPTLITKVGAGRDPNNSDLAWIGKACNYAAHLSGYGKNETYITTNLYNRMNDSAKLSGGKINMWKYKEIVLKDGKKTDVYVSSWIWKVY